MAQEMTQEELSMYEKLYDLIGARIRITSDRTVYQGIIGSIIPGLRMVSLRHTTLIGGEYLGITRFRFREITSLTVIESGEVVNRYPKNDYLIDILKNQAGKKYNVNDVLYDGQLSDPSDDEKSVHEESAEEEFVLEVPSQFKNQLPNDSIIIDSIDVVFSQAIQDIFQQDVIGISFSGPKISRFGKLTSMCISTMEHVYLFDIEMLKIEAFDNGLRDILENSSIKKIIHDCRFPSDCLAHQYCTQLTNVFDTKVADFIISMQRYNDKYEFKFISSLDCCLRNHLQVPPEFLYNHVKKLSNNEKEDYYTKRPINNEFRYDLIKDVLYLILLHKTLAKKLLDPLQKNVNIYLRVLANSTDEEINSLGNELSPPDSIPPSIFMYGIQTVRFYRTKKKSVALKCKFIDPNTGQIIDPKKELYSKNTTLQYSENVKKMTEELLHEEKCILLNSGCEKDNSYLKITKDDLSLSEMCNNIVDITMKPSFRHIDEVYHKLVNNLSLRNQHSESAINAKPLANYASKFTFRTPHSIDHLDEDSLSENSCIVKPVSDATHHTFDYSGLNESSCGSLDDPNVIPLPLKRKYKNIQFVPA